MEQAALVLVGAIVGGVTSAVASVWASHRQFVRATRVEIFRQLLPTVWNDGPDDPRTLDDRNARWEELIRAIEALGGRDARFGMSLELRVRDWQQYRRKARRSDGAGGFFIDEASDAYEQSRRERIKVRRCLSDYNEFLRGKLSSWSLSIGL